MDKRICECGYIYNPTYGDITSDINPGTKFDELPENWQCPFCGSKKESFRIEHKRKKAKFVSFR
ncbi:rubredoxin [Acidaminobacter sp. JC074]|uniref:rubredoxin n=1 Tax=Acidaminobacter sp. JC074 TaxID=2530199 RepID=UPI001F0D1895|nr:rubredoxin [Acidaminobacter sp. JC074]MCH4886811.1 rubredoxin [Acidaminobacter sp. JC074]